LHDNRFGCGDARFGHTPSALQVALELSAATLAPSGRVRFQPLLANWTTKITPENETPIAEYAPDHQNAYPNPHVLRERPHYCHKEAQRCDDSYKRNEHSDAAPFEFPVFHFGRFSQLLPSIDEFHARFRHTTG
jgi:hypothetical protein